MRPYPLASNFCPLLMAQQIELLNRTLPHCHTLLHYRMIPNSIGPCWFDVTVRDPPSFDPSHPHFLDDRTTGHSSPWVNHPTSNVNPHFVVYPLYLIQLRFCSSCCLMVGLQRPPILFIPSSLSHV